MSGLSVRMEALLAEIGPRVTVRFGMCEGAYRWGSVTTEAVAITKLLCLMWNERAVIIASLKASGQ